MDNAQRARVRTLLIRHGVDMSMPANREMAVDLTAFAESVAAEAHAKAIEAAASPFSEQLSMDI